ncbi:hypothetical protein SBA6_600029 [Candidatus Sulfopaludibacter sp. SbA6]|nr:hypothetical protein SBA6_600029 [Candidatus Sulfopaludibacter sp. SbA6]
MRAHRGQPEGRASLESLFEYLKLDSSGQWADIARRQLERLRQATLIHSR